MVGMLRQKILQRLFLKCEDATRCASIVGNRCGQVVGAPNLRARIITYTFLHEANLPMSGWVKTLGAVWINLLRCEPAILVAAGSDLERPFVGSASSTLAAAHTSAADG